MPVATDAPCDDQGPFLMLSEAFGSSRMRRLWSRDRVLNGWLRFESALAKAQGELGLIPLPAATAIAKACTTATIDHVLLLERTRVVGYPILPLLEQLGLADELVDRFVHWGATTQDAMDTGLSLQLRDSTDHLIACIDEIGDSLARLAVENVDTIMPARTHAQHAVPTTFGAKLSVYLGEFTRHRRRAENIRAQVAVVSMFGAGGTSAAYGVHSEAIRRRVAGLLDLEVGPPWHSSRDCLAEALWLNSALAATCAKLGREVIDLSRPEIGELSESGGRLRGASSTMPQKVNPITSEVLVGFGGVGAALAQAAPQIMLAGHERSAGEWQIEWDIVPSSYASASGALEQAMLLIDGLQVHRDRMAANLELGHGTLLAESVMMQLAPALGRHKAHDLVYDSCSDARTQGISLEAAVLARLNGTGQAKGVSFEAQRYLGEAQALVEAAVGAWSASQARNAHA